MGRRPALISLLANNRAVQGERFRLIRWNDGMRPAKLAFERSAARTDIDIHVEEMRVFTT